MKDSTSEILTAFATALSSITYNSKAWHVYKEQPPKGKRNYIYLSDVILNENMDKDHNTFMGSLIIHISAKKDKACRAIVNSLSNSILQALTKVTLSMTNFNMTVSSYPVSVELTEETELDNFVKRLSLSFQTQEK